MTALAGLLLVGVFLVMAAVPLLVAGSAFGTSGVALVLAFEGAALFASWGDA